MNKPWIWVLAGVLCFATQLAAQTDKLPHITVYGEAKEMLVPDEMNWQLAVKNVDAEPVEAAAEHQRLLQELMVFLASQGIEKDKVQTSRMEFGENWVYKNGNRLREGYFAQSGLVFTLDEFDRYDDLWIGLAQLKNIHIRNVHFTISDTVAYFARLRQTALLNAAIKAESMASVLDVEIGEPLIIEEIPSGQVNTIRSRGLMAMEAGEAPAGQPSVMPGLIPVAVSVKVAFRLISFQ